MDTNDARGSERNFIPFLRWIVVNWRRKGSFHEPTLVWSPALRRLCVARPAEAGTPCGQKFKVPMRAQKRQGAFHEPHEFRVRTPMASGGTLPNSKTLTRWPESLELPPGFGVRRPCGALDFQDRFMVPMHGKHAEEALQEPTLVWSPAFRRLCVARPAEAGTPCDRKFMVPMHAFKKERELYAIRCRPSPPGKTHLN